MNETKKHYLAEEPLGKLLLKFSVPCVLSMLVSALYNIVDQIFIANADYLGSYGNAANTVVFPLTVVALAIAAPSIRQWWAFQTRKRRALAGRKGEK